MPTAFAVALGLVAESEVPRNVAMVISHDCDLGNEDLQAEPFVEVVIGSRIAKCSANHTQAKSTRTLHLEIYEHGTLVPFEFLATRKKVIPKERIAGVAPNQDYALQEDRKVTLQNWLASRYRRATFPDNLNRLIGRIKNDLVNLGKESPSAIFGDLPRLRAGERGTGR